MKINTISIKNYRNFETISFELNQHFTVLVGDNASGKTTVLDAIAIAMGTFLLGIDVARLNAKSIAPKDIRTKTINGQARPQLPVEITASGKYNGQQLLDWTRNIDEITAKTTTKFAKAQHVKQLAQTLLTQSRLGENASFPLIVYHGTGRLWAQHETPNYIVNTEGVQKGYDKCLSPKSSSEAFLSWYKTYEDEVNKFNRTDDKLLLEVLKSTILAMVPQWQNIAYSNKEGDLIGTFINQEGVQEQLAYGQLSDGYRNTIGMVADLAYRCIQLNPHLKEQAVQKTEGIVLIDELDLHLHPNWQRTIVADLKRIFPNVQFVATTHSPFIYQSLHANELINLDKLEYPDTEPFKQSIEEAAIEMGVEDMPRSKKFMEMEQTAAQYYDLIAANKPNSKAEITSLQEKLNELEERYSEDPAFVALLKAERKSKNL